MDALNALQTKRINKGRYSFDLLTNRIKEHAITTGKNVEWNTRKTSTSSHIKKIVRHSRKNSYKQERIKNMKGQRLMHIVDTRQVHIRVDLLDIHEMGHATTSSML